MLRRCFPCNVQITEPCTVVMSCVSACLLIGYGPVFHMASRETNHVWIHFLFVQQRQREKIYISDCRYKLNIFFLADKSLG